MIRPIRAIKDEIRILGLDACNEELAVGVVSRGGLYLDGLISFRPSPKDASGEQARRVVHSSFFPELRAVMFHGLGNRRDRHLMERITNLPTLTILEDEPRGKRGYKAFHSRLGSLWVKASLEQTILRKILDASWTLGRLPEPLRVAHLLAQLDLPEISG
jgi:endonuclease V-like protein UPF0215 family